jgi:predicted PurR-regulated permease PerM
MSIPWGSLGSKVLTVAGVAVIVAALHLGSSLFVPLAFAVLLSLILSPLVSFGERMRLPRPLSVVAVVAAVFGVLVLAGFMVAGEAASLARKFPDYRVNGLSKLEVLRVPFAKTLTEFQLAVKDLETGTAVKPPKEAANPEIQKVEIHERPQSPFELASAIGGPLLSAGASVAAVFLLVVFFLIYKTEIRDRVVRLAGDAQVNVTTQTITEAARGVSRFLFLQAIVNTSYGIVFGAVLFVLGVPGAFLWGFLAAVLRFVPYLGPITAGALPILLSLAVFPGWNKPIMVAGFIVGLEIVLNNFVEPIVYGRKTGLSPLAVVLAAVFWAWMWGGIGLILAVPLTVCLVSLGKYAPSLRFLTVALGDEPALDPKVQVYHRLLGRLQVEATELLEKEMAGAKSLSEFYDSVLLPVLRMAETDIQIGKLDEGMAAYLIVALREIVDDLAESARWERGKEIPAVPPSPCRASVLCLPAGSKADELSAHMLAQVLTLRGRPAKALGLDHLADETMETVKSEGADLLVICTSPPSNLIRARYLYKRLRRHFGDIAVVQGVWGGGDARPNDPRIVPDGKATLVFSFVEAENAVGELPREDALRSRVRLGVA